jgi:hypothetical protein
LQVYISYALMEASTLGGEDEDEEEEDPGSPEKARAVFERGYKELKTRGEKENVSSQAVDKSVGLLTVNFLVAGCVVGGLEDFRGGAWRRRIFGKGADIDAKGHEEVATGRRRIGSGRM